jgi:hypothetical protein
MIWGGKIMKKMLTAGIAALALAIPAAAGAQAGPGSALGPIVSAPTSENFRAFCVVNHGALFGPGAIGDASSARGGGNADVYRPGGLAETVCRAAVTP